ncbi:ras guanine nucleotide exchange factor domain-containing protein [Schizophyllum commune]
MAQQSPRKLSTAVPLMTSRTADTGAPSPALSVTSRDSYTTAQSTFDGAPVASSSSSTAGLRKSVSVDSFVGRTSPTSRRSPRPDYDLVHHLPPVDDRQPLSAGRIRGQSISSTRNLQLANDSDVEFSDSVPPSAAERYRSTSLKGHGRPVRPGDLPLPSRTPTLSTASSITTNSSLSSSTQGEAPSREKFAREPGAPRLQSSTSLQSIPQKIAPPISLSGRTRSGSVGVPPTTRKLLVTPQQREQMKQNSPVNVVVLGTTGCGKSSVIRRGLKGFSLSDPSSYVPSSPLPGVSRNARCTRRTGRITDSDLGPECPLYVVEADVSPSDSFAPIAPSQSRLDGICICYDASDEETFEVVEDLLRCYQNLKIPTIVMACKSDLTKKVHPGVATKILERYHSGLIELTCVDDVGKEKVRRTFEFLIKTIIKQRRLGFDPDTRNPASPDVFSSGFNWDTSRTSTPTGMGDGSNPPSRRPSEPSLSSLTTTSQLRPKLTIPTTKQSSSSSSSMPRSAEPPSDTEKAPARLSSSTGLTSQQNDSSNSLQVASGTEGAVQATPSSEGPQQPKKEKKEKDQRPAQWATIDELLDKLLFLSVSGDDPVFVTHFLLTYRRFSTPRKLLLAMQKRMRDLDKPSGDPMFACFAQMRICHLLETWIHDYPHDFAVKGSYGALNALVRSIVSKTYLLHYGSDFLPFVEQALTYQDTDSQWAKPVDDFDDTEDEMSILEDEEEIATKSVTPSVDEPSEPARSTGSVELTRGAAASTSRTSPASRERKQSLPLTRSLMMNSSSAGGQPDEEVPKHQIKELLKISQQLALIDSTEIAQEITRIEAKAFLEIEPRHWLRYTFVSGRKDPKVDSIARFNAISERLADWVVSLILCHDRAKARAKQIEKFVDIAQKLRALNNYSALRAFVAGINNSTFPGDQTMEQFKSKSPEQAKNLQSWDVLLQHIRSHRAYRLALRNTKGPCIPALEVHISDLIRANEGNPDYFQSDPSKIHWGKFNMMGRFVSQTTQYRTQCQSSADYNFPRREHIEQLLNTPFLMSVDMQKSRIAPPDADFDDAPMMSRTQSGQPKDVAVLRKLFFW